MSGRKISIPGFKIDPKTGAVERKKTYATRIATKKKISGQERVRVGKKKPG